MRWIAGASIYRSTRITGILLLIASLAAFIPSPAHSAELQSDQFASTWQRTDLPVREGHANRTWLWAPQPFTVSFWETYEESPGTYREVQYFDKSRMEINDPNAVDDGVWFVTNGLLVVEMVEGKLQLGDTLFHHRAPRGVPVAGDPDDTSGPTYAALSQHRSPTSVRQGEIITTRIDRNGNLNEDVGLASWGITNAHYDDVTGHNIAAPFWRSCNPEASSTNQPICSRRAVSQRILCDRPANHRTVFADVKVGGEIRVVLLQCFERRCLTYTPDNPPVGRSRRATWAALLLLALRLPP